MKITVINMLSYTMILLSLAVFIIYTRIDICKYIKHVYVMIKCNLKYLTINPTLLYFLVNRYYQFPIITNSLRYKSIIAELIRLSIIKEIDLFIDKKSVVSIKINDVNEGKIFIDCFRDVLFEDEGNICCKDDLQSNKIRQIAINNYFKCFNDTTSFSLYRRLFMLLLSLLTAFSFYSNANLLIGTSIFFALTTWLYFLICLIILIYTFKSDYIYIFLKKQDQFRYMRSFLFIFVFALIFILLFIIGFSYKHVLNNLYPICIAFLFIICFWIIPSILNNSNLFFKEEISDFNSEQKSSTLNEELSEKDIRLLKLLPYAIILNLEKIWLKKVSHIMINQLQLKQIYNITFIESCDEIYYVPALIENIYGALIESLSSLLSSNNDSYNGYSGTG